MFVSYKNVSINQSRDTGMAMVLLFLIFGNFFFNITFLNILAIPILVITMTIPIIFKPLAVLWFGFAHLIGLVMSRVILTLIFFGMIVPVGLCLRVLNYDPLKLKLFKKSGSSVFSDRNHTFTKKDIDNPY